MNNKKEENRKTELRISKNGRKYWWSPGGYKNRIEKENEKRKIEGKKLLGQSIKFNNKPYCYDEESPSYMRYWKKKEEIRNEYPTWVHMNREMCREYFSRVWDLIHNDSDYLQWKEESKTQAERLDDEWWLEKKRKEENYDGHNDEMSW